MQYMDVPAQYRAYKDEFDPAIQQVLTSGGYILGPEVLRLEERLAAYVGSPHCVTVSSGTDALLIPLMALDVGPGDEVITVPFTFISTAEVIELLGAKSIFIDIDPDTFNMDATQLEAAITDKTKAIIPVSLFGQMPDMTAINAIAAAHNIPVIEDGAQSFGAEQNGVKSSGASVIATTSFYPTKPLSCFGEGGAVCTTDEEITQKMMAIRNHGSLKRDYHDHVGINGRLEALQGAVLNVKLDHFDDEVATRQRLGARYSAAFAECENVQAPVVAEGNTHVYAQYTLRVKNRAAFIEHMTQQDVPTCVFYSKCLHQQPVFAHLGYGPGSLPVAEAAANEVVSLPMHAFLTEADQDAVIAAVKGFVG